MIDIRIVLFFVLWIGLTIFMTYIWVTKSKTNEHVLYGFIIILPLFMIVIPFTLAFLLGLI